LSDARVHETAFVHESAYVDEGASVGANTRIWHFCHVNPGAVIGERCSLGQNVVVMPKVRIGDNVKIQNNVSVYEGVELEDDVFCGPSMVFTNVTNPRSHVSRKHEYRRTLVRRGASIGANATIVCGATLGEYAFVGAGAVVARDVPAYALVVGVPARRVGWMWQCGERLPDRPSADAAAPTRCAACGSAYVERDGELHPVGTR
jgi:UDP-2-acetamido-3-amino-2,3-dideoxy-glucuronate N-acetyltransferase